MTNMKRIKSTTKPVHSGYWCLRHYTGVDGFILEISQDRFGTSLDLFIPDCPFQGETPLVSFTAGTVEVVP